MYPLCLHLNTLCTVHGSSMSLIFLENCTLFYTTAFNNNNHSLTNSFFLVSLRSSYRSSQNRHSLYTSWNCKASKAKDQQIVLRENLEGKIHPETPVMYLAFLGQFCCFWCFFSCSVHSTPNIDIPLQWDTTAFNSIKGFFFLESSCCASVTINHREIHQWNVVACKKSFKII